MMGCRCSQPAMMSGLMGDLTAGSRALYQGIAEIPYFEETSILRALRAYLEQRGLTVENIQAEYVSAGWSGARFVRVFIQVVTPIDRANEDDLRFDISQDLQRAAQSAVSDDYLTVLVRATPGPSGEPTYPGYPGGGTGLPQPSPSPSPSGPGFFDQLSADLGLGRQGAMYLLIGGAVLAIALIAKR